MMKINLLYIFFFSIAKKRSKKVLFYNSPKELTGAPLHCGRYRRQSSRSNSIPKSIHDKMKYSERESIFILFTLRSSSVDELWLLTSRTKTRLRNYRTRMTRKNYRSLLTLRKIKFQHIDTIGVLRDLSIGFARPPLFVPLC